MNSANYTAMISALDERINNCSTNFDSIKTTEDIGRLSISEAKRLRDIAKSEVEKMTTFAMVELYHIIGMGNLTATQQSGFLKRTKEYLNYRPVIKSFANSLSSIDDLPEIDRDTMYKLRVLGGNYLVSGDAGKAKEDFASIKEYKTKGLADAIKASELDFKLEGRQITISESQLANFCKDGNLVGVCPGINIDVLRKKITNGCDYCGISWYGFDSDGNAVGTVIADSSRKKMKEYLNLRKELLKPTEPMGDK